jgi:hypothetical protein
LLVGATPSFTSVRSPVTPVAVRAGPKSAGAALQNPAIEDGLLMITKFLSSVWAVQVPSERAASGVSVPIPLILSTVSPQMSEYDSFRAPDCHW